MTERERMRIHDNRDSRGWQPKMSGGIGVWQLVPGGKFQEFVGRS